MEINPQQNFSDVKDITPVFYTIEDFERHVIIGDFIDADGVGYYANEEKISSVKVMLSEIREDHDNPLPTPRTKDCPIRRRMMNGTHVAWFPKQEE